VLEHSLSLPQVTAVSSKKNTTRGQVLGVLTTGSTQLVIFDTPGINEEKLAKKCAHARSQACGLVLVVVACSFQKELSSTAWTTSSECDLGQFVHRALNAVDPLSTVRCHLNAGIVMIDSVKRIGDAELEVIHKVSTFGRHLGLILFPCSGSRARGRQSWNVAGACAQQGRPDAKEDEPDPAGRTAHRVRNFCRSFLSPTKLFCV
jgi:hypothetical protein